MATDVSTSLPDLTLSPGMTVTVVLDDNAADVNGLTIKVFQVIPETRPAATPILLRGR